MSCRDVRPTRTVGRDAFTRVTTKPRGGALAIPALGFIASTPELRFRESFRALCALALLEAKSRSPKRTD